jgi:DNA-binding Xre family transcriptional regulator
MSDAATEMQRADHVDTPINPASNAMRFRIPELLDDAGLTAYGLAQASDGRISLSTAFRLVRLRGNVKTFDAAVMEALCDLLEVEPGDLFERTKTPKRRRR